MKTQIYSAMSTIFLLIPGVAAAEQTSDAMFFAIYDQVNQADIEIARLGVISGSSIEVRTIAATILQDHAAVQQMARDIAADAGIKYVLPADEGMAKDHKATIAKLSALSGASFDEAYLAHEVPFHRNASIAVRDSLVPRVENAEFRAHLEAVLPHFQNHLNLSIEAAAKLGYEVD